MTQVQSSSPREENEPFPEGIEKTAGNGRGSSPGPGDVLAAGGGVLCITAALALPWARVDLAWKGLLTRQNFPLGTYSFHLLENPWLAGISLFFAAAVLVSLAWRRRAGTAVILCTLPLFACFLVYLVSLITEALDFLGFYQNLLDLVRTFPFIGPALESAIREHLLVSAYPHAGMFLFLLGAVTSLAGGILILRRRNALRIPPPPPPLSP